MPRPLPTDPALDDLLAHAGWLRRLATELVHDADLAQDLAQEVFLRAARQRPSGLESPRAWLAAVARKLAFTERRSAARRAERESQRPAREPGRATDELVAEAELGREVARLALELEEPYRAVVLMRFWRDLPPRRIAAELERPVETVKVQLRRGLEKLRSRLDHQHGDRESWAVLLVPLAMPRVAPLATSIGAPLVWAAGVATTCAAAWIVLGDFDDPQPTRTAVVQAAAPTPRAARTPGMRVPVPAIATPSPERTAAVAARAAEAAPKPVVAEVAPPEPPTATTEVAPARTELIRGRLRNERGKRLTRVLLAASPGSPTSPGAPDPQQALTGAGGLFTLAAASATEIVSGTDEYLVFGNARAEGRDFKADHDLFAAETVGVIGTVRDERGEPWVGLEVEFTALCPARISELLPSGTGLRSRRWTTKTREQGMFMLLLPRIGVEVRAVDQPRLRFEFVPSTLPRAVLGQIRGDPKPFLEHGYLDLAKAPRQLAFDLVLSRRRPGPVVRVHGTVLRFDGQPAAAARVLLAGVETATDSQGRFDFEVGELEAQDALAIFEPGQSPLWLPSFASRADGTAEVIAVGRLHLPAGAEVLEGVLLDSSGEPLVDRRFWLADPTRVPALDDSLEAHASEVAGKWTYSGPGGRFRIAGLLPRDYRVQVAAGKDEVRTFGPFPAGCTGLRLVVED